MKAEGEVILCAHNNSKKCTKPLKALFDSGASISITSEKVAEELGYEKFDKPKELGLAAKDEKAKLIGQSTVDIEMEGCRFPVSDVLGVVEKL